MHALQPEGPAPPLGDDYVGWVHAHKRKWRAARGEAAAKRQRMIQAQKAEAAAVRRGA